MNSENNCFFFRKKKYLIESNGTVTKKSYSNIALIKYWGKHTKKIQIPLNSSISYSLSNVYTVTRLIYYIKKKKSNNFSLKIFLSGKRTNIFLPKIRNFFQRISYYCSYLQDYNFIIETHNTFPHSCGIASSASSMSALSLCIMEIEKKLVSSLTRKFFFKKASFLSRLGSGSACRSIYSGLVVWGYHKYIKGSSNLYSIRYPYQVHPIFTKMLDTILIVDEKPKKILSSKGHQLMNRNPYAKERFKYANRNMNRLISILKTGDLQEFGKLVEYESLTLHAMMMTSNPYYLCMKPNTLSVIHTLWNFRIESKKNIYFSLDSGANVHLLYPTQEKESISKWIESDLLFYCKQIITSFCIY